MLEFLYLCLSDCGTEVLLSGVGSGFLAYRTLWKVKVSKSRWVLVVWQHPHVKAMLGQLTN